MIYSYEMRKVIPIMPQYQKFILVLQGKNPSFTETMQ